VLLSWHLFLLVASRVNNLICLSDRHLTEIPRLTGVRMWTCCRCIPWWCWRFRCNCRRAPPVDAPFVQSQIATQSHPRFVLFSVRPGNMSFLYSLFSRTLPSGLFRPRNNSEIHNRWDIPYCSLGGRSAHFETSDISREYRKPSRSGDKSFGSMPEKRLNWLRISWIFSVLQFKIFCLPVPCPRT
jgi:hypothetical protein